MNEFYVYVYFRPWNGTPCYVGKGKGRRWLVHDRLRTDHYNQRLARIFAKAGGSLPKVKVRENITEAEAFATEVALIAAIGRGKNGPLVNMTDGGEGVTGFLGRIKSPEECAAISRGKMGHTVLPETRAKLSKALTGFVHTEETRRRVSEGVRNSPKTKARIVPIPEDVVAAALRGDASVCSLAKVHNLPRRTLAERVLAAKRAA